MMLKLCERCDLNEICSKKDEYYKFVKDMKDKAPSFIINSIVCRYYDLNNIYNRCYTREEFTPKQLLQEGE